MTAPANLEAVKAMLFDALGGAICQWAGLYSHTGDDAETTVERAAPDRARQIGAHADVIEFSGPGSQGGSWVILDADKLAATVAEWFAAREGRAND